MKKVRSSIIFKAAIVLMLSGCKGELKTYTCTLDQEPFILTYHIKCKNERIKEVMMKTTIDKDIFDRDEDLIERYLEHYENYQLTDDEIIIYEDADIKSNEVYSIKKTIDALKQRGYKCH